MTTEKPSFAALLAALEQLLEEERAILLSGAPEQIDAITQRKLALAQEIERRRAERRGGTAEIDTLSNIARLSRQNFVVCSTMLRHMTAVLDKLRRHAPHRSYRPDGTESDTPSQRPLGAA